MKQFQISTKILLDDTAEHQLLALPMQRAMFICDPFLRQNGMYDSLREALTEKGVVCACFSDTIPDPPLEAVIAGAQSAVQFQPDAVVAIGGGSAIDTAKLVTHIYRQIRHQAEVCLIAIPTTSGTGTEVTAFSIVTDREKAVKYALVDDVMLPNIAILDPELVRTLPAAVTADTGMDVLTHALEAYAAKGANDFTDALAEKAVRLTFTYLARSVKDGNDMEARQKMLVASSLAGSAFNGAGLGLNHAMAHALGGRFHIPHGRANALLLPHVIAYNAKEQAVAQRYQALAAMLRLPSANETLAVSSLVRQIQTLKKEIGLNCGVCDCGVDKDTFLAHIGDLAEAAMKDNCYAANPVAASQEDIAALYHAII